MIPKSVSATALNNAEACLSMFHAQNIEYAKGFENDAAKLGTTCHSALETYVDNVYIKKIESPSAEGLETLFQMYWMKNFGPIDEDNPLYNEGVEMMNRWSDDEAEHFANRTPLTLEQKKFFLLETSAGPIRVNYILDRFDAVGDPADKRYAVIDYKSQRKNVSERALKELLQADLYALAMYLEYPDAEEMQVTFDMLRYQKTTITVTKDQARATMTRIYEIVEKILATPEDNIPETLNTSCNYCVRKATCGTLLKNIEVGGLFSLDLKGQIDLATELELKLKGMKALKDELETVLEETLGKDEVTELFTGKSKAHFTVPRKNKITSIDDVRRVATDAVFFRYGKTDIGIGQFDKMLKDSSLSDEQRAELKTYKVQTYDDPRLHLENSRDEATTEAIAPDLTGKLTAAPLEPIIGLED